MMPRNFVNVCHCTMAMIALPVDLPAPLLSWPAHVGAPDQTTWPKKHSPGRHHTALMQTCFAHGPKGTDRSTIIVLTQACFTQVVRAQIKPGTMDMSSISAVKDLTVEQQQWLGRALGYDAKPGLLPNLGGLDTDGLNFPTGVPTEQ